MRDQRQTIQDLGLTVDLRAEPWHYPGPFLPFSCLQIAEELLPLLVAQDGTLTVVVDGYPEDLEQRLGTLIDVALSECHVVVAIGSNASPDVLRAKFDRRGVSTTVAQFIGQIDGVALGYSAHVSPSGYVPAAPYPRVRASTAIVVSALTDEQLRCVDETEPNYNRIAVPRDWIRLAVPLPLPAFVDLYESKWGVIVDPAGEPLHFGPQERIFHHLDTWDALPPSIAIDSGIPAITHAVGADAGAREWITSRLIPHAKRYTIQG